jgi:hypothetical protein
MKAILKNPQILRHNEKEEIKVSRAKSIQLLGIVLGKDY